MTNVDDETEEFTCADCGKSGVIDDEPVYEDLDGRKLCLDCAEDSAAAMRYECEEFAREHVRLTGRPHRYLEEYWYAPSRDEYQDGDREAYTENAVAAHNRHSCTNYDELISGLDRGDPWDRALYDAIRVRVEEVIDECLASERENDE